uniref:Ras of Complex, Roc, domain of DAPkinase n=1 Tax=Candidatus Kentrum sp. MB TaxID=2138164 RepID=A0A451BBC1_9GAMM|nr:MAG: Ras of Complex, Roc, domain of DAPkinase [Candidatus Kentron sp. MB]VFK75591.1 MAG: Ras of Complex, Roc, domain of DAPkinase [Candidatus Kentron sp. MB]
MTNKQNLDISFDRQAFRTEVKARLEEINAPRRAAAFAARVALATLPGLAEQTENKGFLWYWQEEDRERHLLVVCHALQLAWSLTVDHVPGLRADAKAADVVRTVAARARVAIVAIVAADAIDAAVARATRAARAAATDAAVVAVTFDHRLMDWIRAELTRLAKARNADAYLRAADPVPEHPLQAQFLAGLRGIPSFEYWADWFQDRFENKPIDREILKKSVRLPEEIRAQDPRAINRYLADLSGKEEKIKRVRAIFIGNGEAGKTSLIQALNGETVMEGGTDMTCGIDIGEWPVADTDLTAHFWDFGGQVIAHATHQFFLRARCVYVLVLNARSADSNPNQQAEYWLEFIRAFGADAPVLLVGNKCDLTPVWIRAACKRATPISRGFIPSPPPNTPGPMPRNSRSFTRHSSLSCKWRGRRSPTSPGRSSPSSKSCGRGPDKTRSWTRRRSMRNANSVASIKISARTFSLSWTSWER